MPETARAQRVAGCARGGLPRASSASARMWSGVRAAAAADHVHPALLDEAPQLAREHLAASRVAARSRRAGPAFGTQATGTRDERGERAQVVGHELRTGRAVEADVEQIACASEAESASTPWPASIVPIGSMVPRDRDRQRRAPSVAKRALDAEQRRLDVARVLAGLEQQVVDAALDAGPRPAREVLGQLVEGDAAGDRDRLRGRPHRAGDEARPRPASSARRRPRARGAAAASVDLVAPWPASPYSASTSGVAPKVLVSIDVRAGVEVARVDVADRRRAG